MSCSLPDIASTFQEDGFAIARSFLDGDELAELDRQINRYIDEVLPFVPRIHKVYESGWSGPLKHFSRLELYDDFFKGVFHRAKTIELVEACLSTAVEPFTSEVFCKPARVGGAAAAHQDNAYFNFLPPYGLVVWIALDEVTLANGAVHFAQGSHQLGKLPHEHTGNPLFGRALVGTPNPTRHPEVPALLNPGDASIHHFLTVHRSGPNRTDRSRRGFVMDYKAREAERDENANADQEAYKKDVYRKSGAM